MKKLKWLVGVGFALGLTSVSQAALISYGGSVAGDGSGLTSVYMDPTQAPLPGSELNGYFIETFDIATQMSAFNSAFNQAQPDTQFNQDPATGCALNSSAAGIVASGNFGIGKGNISGRAAPAGDITCFGYTPATGGASSGTVTIDYSPFLATFGSFKINYLGFYWGSADVYNTLKFFNGQDEVISFGGSQLLSENSGQSGNQVARGSNVYVNIAFDANEVFDRIELISTSRAMEVDNIVIGITQVPEPAGIAALGLGLLLVRRLVKK